MTGVLAALLAALSFASLFIGALDMDLSGLAAGDADQWFVLLASRLPRLLAILCTGAGMSVAGLLMQQLTMNRFVSPTTGATIQSAQFGILLALLFMPESTLMGRAAFAFVCATLGTWLFVWLISRIRFKDPIMVPLIGIMFGYVVTGVTDFLAYGFDMNQALTTWLTGHFSLVTRGHYELVFLSVPMIVAAFVFADRFNIVGLGRDVATNLGVSYSLVLFSGLTIAAVITAAVVVTVGSISYIGLIVPNIVSMLKGDRLKGTLVDTALFGALFVLVCDLVARLAIFPFELPIELVIGIVGSAVFIALIIYKLNHGRTSLAGVLGTRARKGMEVSDAE